MTEPLDNPPSIDVPDPEPSPAPDLELVGTEPPVPPKISGACPNCKNTGPHTAFADPRDPEFAHVQPVQCVSCGYEFAVVGS